MYFCSVKNWFEEWFNSKYYHILYDHRNDEDAKAFLRPLVDFLQPKKTDKILDLACGKGRHSQLLHSMGYLVWGCDIAPDNITEAKQMEDDGLHFFQHDMRMPLTHHFDFVLNLFTSFGYFDTDEEHIQTLHHIYNALHSNGTFVIDFLNIHKILKNLITDEVITKKGIDFFIKREIQNGYLIKSIAFKDEGQHFNFQEKVRAFTQKDFITMLENQGFECKHFFGEYNLSKFSEEMSSRLIIIAQKC